MVVELVTFGCRLNLVESETIERQALAAGLSDLAVINTCAVTTEAVRQAGQAIRRLAREKPERPIVVTGCAAQIEPARFAAMPQVARVLGNAEKLDMASWRGLASSNSLRTTSPDGDPAGKIAVGDIMQARDATPHRTRALGQHTRGFLQVQNGCDHRCTFCVIPLGRGNARSAGVAEVVAQARRLVEDGASEIVLTGVDLTSYGRERSEGPTLGALVAAILAALPELKRLRLSSLDAVEVDDDLRSLIAEEPRLMPHLHLSLQAGDDLVLKRMKRRHSRADAVRFCDEMRGLRPEIVFGADLIAGFPTEDETMFSRTLGLIEECGLSYVHGFPFSPRPGTPAARMPQVAGGEIKERAARLREAAEAAHVRHLAARIGRPLSVLTERGDTGRAEDFTLVHFGRSVAPGQILPVTAHAQAGKSLLAA
ncbi:MULTISPECIES: tRNA (N(6)-L-threonylcarbamoyladenosine(37)-C(2))-methylthiotransferase MtaB [unclassified Bosea (in: a-proteobacteria)]|uniref:tRNA (N(6)-L-threonylcarbamoyladenosine(37)-C(2))- methylthiotransferase MtaB n=1 Tax=unclassified Bosea (in: a-proteobacteria) TaxID=2653178 RepID=UPI000F76550A|nr:MULTISPECIES: tRNA (N(6)-L-threonylcarbamoyladenosine(37)-C(2))-methylthiotransferase MtaB [unclassified Bosea (in: a-proteobacteria)]AZO78585.1 tRNA (N(6)-L-threonylcarbamoyladenosine(37)-C(2))-methylthiotransferase MtaB [Bosea sp. Tri-49]RXT17629.1 tRNA (N(6)-L-threonylcarbamoyladenosine(37)-C(2))-methylthiotransferase MtaB [Bosea sp. Tri-39]RXT41002.1 tRNA (N(6)-L-threonylcarbamoyladenosine(37)-C(2))-methylthiotransferase MtaB [Bosea sp. Tri-54]